MNKIRKVMIMSIALLILFSTFIHAETTGAEEKISYYMEKHQENWLAHLENLGGKRTKDILQESEEKIRDLIYELDSKEIRDKMIDELQMLEEDMEAKLAEETELAKIKEKESDLEWEEKRKITQKNFITRTVIATFILFFAFTGIFLKDNIC